MANTLVKIVVGGLAIVGAGIAYRIASARPNEDFRNYEVGYRKLEGWKELPHSPNTLLLMRDPKTNALLRCAATQVVSKTNPEPDMDTVNLVKRVVLNARENQPDWKTDHLSKFDNGKVRFELFRKVTKDKTVVAAMAVRGNTTVLVSLSNTGEHGKRLMEGQYRPLLEFLSTIDLQLTDKWEKIHRENED